MVAANLTRSAEAKAALASVDKVYLATNGPDQYVAETNVITAARDSDIRHLVRVSVIGAHQDHFVQLAQVHAQLDQLLKESGIPTTVLRPNWFIENFLGSADTILAHGAIYGSAGDGRVAFIDSRDTAAVAVMALTEGGHVGNEYELTGPEALTFSEAAQRIGAGIGRVVTYVNLDDAAFRSALLGAGVPTGTADVVLQINRNARENHLATVTDTVATLLGRSARSVEAFARDNLRNDVPTPV